MYKFISNPVSISHNKQHENKIRLVGDNRNN